MGYVHALTFGDRAEDILSKIPNPKKKKDGLLTLKFHSGQGSMSACPSWRILDKGNR